MPRLAGHEEQLATAGRDLGEPAPGEREQLVAAHEDGRLDHAVSIVRPAA